MKYPVKYTKNVYILLLVISVLINYSSCGETPSEDALCIDKLRAREDAHRKNKRYTKGTGLRKKRGQYKKNKNTVKNSYKSKSKIEPIHNEEIEKEEYCYNAASQENIPYIDQVYVAEDAQALNGKVELNGEVKDESVKSAEDVSIEKAYNYNDYTPGVTPSPSIASLSSSIPSFNSEYSSEYSLAESETFETHREDSAFARAKEHCECFPQPKERFMRYRNTPKKKHHNNAPIPPPISTMPQRAVEERWPSEYYAGARNDNAPVPPPISTMPQRAAEEAFVNGKASSGGGKHEESVNPKKKEKMGFFKKLKIFFQ
ncbi:hypothetical protein NEFER03_0844 [Nematocida sp. LUAm3]|nr:hypothetical protein NEFER03_0844 [Nematocida sp. LUAm3]KAI5174862.1 hypothetical protein NEFER02_0962 [Nematocida sp. LUAm2]KAI5177540.1 hypothetical protein NEFER01_0790 [Nematocida sp. LUAm1]